MDRVRRWLLLWRVERIEVISPMSLDEAEAALAASAETRRYGAWRAGSGAGSHVITGRIHDRKIRLSANPPRTTNAWNAVLRAELIPLPAGCRLVGRLGWLPSVRIFSACWLACVVAVFMSGVVLLAYSETHGHGTGGYLFMCLVPLGMATLFVGGVAFFGFIGRKNASFLREWLRQTLSLPEGAIPDQAGAIHQFRQPCSPRAEFGRAFAARSSHPAVPTVSFTPHWPPARDPGHCLVQHAAHFRPGAPAAADPLRPRNARLGEKRTGK